MSVDAAYQKPLIYNKFLPYAAKLNEESEQLFQDIKHYLSVAVQKSELWPGTIYWTHRLNSFLQVYGFQFSKEDHIKLIHFLYSLVTIPNLESPLVHSWSLLLSKLLNCGVFVFDEYVNTELFRKWRLLSPEDLQLPWKPLYKLFREVFFSKFNQLGRMVYSGRDARAVQLLISQARNYFPPESTEEMLEEWRPLLCPFDYSLVEALMCMSEFLPTLLPTSVHEKGFRLWFDELMQLWLSMRYPSPAEELFVKLFVRLAKHTLGYLDWSPYVSQIFTRILRSFQLPVGQKDFQVDKSERSHFTALNSSSLIVSLLGGECNNAQQRFSQLVLALESYYHPSNVGRQTKKLLQFMKGLSSHLINRLKRERKEKSDWFPSIPDGTKLKDTDIDTFVLGLLPLLKMAMFSKVGSIDAASTYHNLALIRPEMVLPDLLNCTYTAFDSLIEPHQLTATLHCVTAVSRSLLSGGNGRYPEGKKHLFSLLTLALPGFDPNDFRKTLVSGLLVGSLVSLVPLVDCSAATGTTHFNMTQEEIELCSLTSQFEDFVLQFMDRCFYLTENARVEQATAVDRLVSSTSKHSHESIVGIGISGTFYSVLVQCSPQIFEVALYKLFQFATTKVFESETAGRMCCDMCVAAAKVDSLATLKLFVPHCVRIISAILNDSEQVETEKPDNELIWNIHLISQILSGRGDGILPFSDDLISCLKKCFYMKSKFATVHVAKAFRKLFACLTTIYPLESRSTHLDFKSSATEHLYIRDWAVVADISAFFVSWHIPNHDELQLADRLLSEFLQPAFDELKAFVDGNQTDRDRLHTLLDYVLNIVIGCSAYMPVWNDNQVEGCPVSVVPMERGYYCTSLSGKLPPPPFRRDAIAKTLHHITDHFLKFCEDDTKSLMKLTHISWIILVNYGSTRAELDQKWRDYSFSKLVFEDKLHHKKHHIRQTIITRTQLQHELRQVERSMSVLSPLHLTLIKDLLRLSVSEYAQVRRQAQNALSSCVDSYLYAGRKLLPDIVPFLKSDDGILHEQFKGALHVMLLPSIMSVYVHDWALMTSTLPALVVSDHSEKVSIIALMEKIIKEIQNKYRSFSLAFKVPLSCHSSASNLYTDISDDAKQDGKLLTEELNQQSIKSYEELIKNLVNLFEVEKLQWRHKHMAMKFLIMLIRHDHPLPTIGVKLLVNALIDDSLAIRKLAVAGVILLLQQQKRKHEKIPLDVEEEGQSVHKLEDIVHGERTDIKWLCYNPDKLPLTEDQWNKFIFIDKTHWGYYCWPKTLLYVNADKQPETYEELSESEMIVYEAFNSTKFVQQLLLYFSLEEEKGKDKYRVQRYTLFKYLFRNHGSRILSHFKPHLEQLALDSHESCQRCAAEVIAGLVSGSKLWNFNMVKEIQEFLQPLLYKILEAVTVETIEDWACCFTNISANRDPRRIHWLIEILMVDPLHGHNGSFLDSSRLYLLQCVLAEQEWRVPNLQYKLLEYLKHNLSHSFKNVRERIGSVLSQMFLCDTIDIMPVKYNPGVKEFLTFIQPSLLSLRELSAASVDKHKCVIKICETVLTWISSSYSFTNEHFQLLSKLFPLITLEEHDEIIILIKKACTQAVHAEISAETAKAGFLALKEAISCEIWKVRVLGLQLIQILIFENLFMFETFSEDITEMLLNSMSDLQTEVREFAASTIAGLVQCGFIKYVKKLKDMFVEQATIKLPVCKLQGREAEYEEFLVKRHSGVLGLSALIEACPYSVPEWLPEVLVQVASHNHDPAPIQGTVKKVLSDFRRTHHDSWNEHKKYFTDDQLIVLTDLLISPSYYA